MKIGVAVTTTPNRAEVFKQWYLNYAKVAPNLFLYIHNDVDYKGVAYSKNKCLKALYEADCTDMFLFDDDCFPVMSGWEQPYVNSGLNHACWNYSRKVMRYGIKGEANPPLYEPSFTNFIVTDKPNGCMLYSKRIVLDEVGGWDMNFKGYGWDHVNWSDRIFNAGLTPERYIDIPNSKHLFRLADCPSSIGENIRVTTIPVNYALYQQNFNSKEFKPFK